VVKKNFILLAIHISSVIPFCAFSQGLINNGAHIVMNGAAFVNIQGATGNYLSQAGGIIDNTAVGGTMYFTGDWTNNSANNGFSNDGTTVVLNGGNQNIGGTNSTIFYSFVCTSVGNKTLNINTTVGGQNLFNGQLTLGAFSHPVVLNGYRLDITNPLPSAIFAGSGFIVSETNVALNPSIVRWHVGINSGAYLVPFGLGGTQIPFTFNITAPMTAGTDYVDVSTRATAVSTNTPWSSTVTHMFDPTIGADGSVQAVVDRWWDLKFTAACTSTLTFSYFGTENTLIVPYNTGNLGAQYWASAWIPDNSTIGSAAAVLAGVGAVTAPGVPFVAGAYTPMVLSSTTAPLPIELVSFAAGCTGNNEQISWSTASELNNDYFTVERCDDGINFNSIGRVNGSGTTSQTHNYSFSDPNPVLSSTYYRLRQTDYNGVTTTSNVIVGESCGDKDFIDAFSAGSGVNVLMNVSEAADYLVCVYDISGKKITEEKDSATVGANHFLINEILPASGIYMVRITSANQNTFSKKLLLTGE
jgi:hypothetical protein